MTTSPRPDPVRIADETGRDDLEVHAATSHVRLFATESSDTCRLDYSPARAREIAAAIAAAADAIDPPPADLTPFLPERLWTVPEPVVDLGLAPYTLVLLRAAADTLDDNDALLGALVRRVLEEAGR